MLSQIINKSQITIKNKGLKRQKTTKDIDKSEKLWYYAQITDRGAETKSNYAKNGQKEA